MMKIICDGCKKDINPNVFKKRFINVSFSEDITFLEDKHNYHFCELCYDIFSKDLKQYLKSKFH